MFLIIQIFQKQRNWSKIFVDEINKVFDEATIPF